MATNLAIDDNLIKAAVRVGHHKTKKAAVSAALQEYIQHHEQLEIFSLFDKIEYAPDYDYKAQRRKM